MNFRDILMVAATQGGGGVAAPTLGPELWPQPAFNASTGLANTHCSVTGGKLVFDNSGSSGSCIGTLSGGTIAQGDVIQYSLDIAGITAAGDSITMYIGVGGKVVTSLSTDGTLTGTVTLTGVVTAQTVRFIIALNDSGVVTIDNVSIKKLS